MDVQRNLALVAFAIAFSSLLSPARAQVPVARVQTAQVVPAPVQAVAAQVAPVVVPATVKGAAAQVVPAPVQAVVAQVVPVVVPATVKGAAAQVVPAPVQAVAAQVVPAAKTVPAEAEEQELELDAISATVKAEAAQVPATVKAETAQVIPAAVKAEAAQVPAKVQMVSGRDLLAPAERAALRRAMRQARTPQEKQRIMERACGTLRQRAQARGAILLEPVLQSAHGILGGAAAHMVVEAKPLPPRAP
ncbi:exported hypothetical protein [Gammaproteobacteria bacterium]